MFRVTETFYAPKGSTTFVKGFLNVESDKDVFMALVGDLFQDMVDDAAGYEDEDEEQAELQNIIGQRKQIIKDRDTGDFTGHESYYGCSSYSWEPVELRPHELTAITDLGFLLES